MSMESFLKVRETGKELKEKIKNEEIDYNYLTALKGHFISYRSLFVIKNLCNITLTKKATKIDRISMRKCIRNNWQEWGFDSIFTNHIFNDINLTLSIDIENESCIEIGIYDRHNEIINRYFNDQFEYSPLIFPEDW